MKRTFIFLFFLTSLIVGACSEKEERKDGQTNDEQQATVRLSSSELSLTIGQSQLLEALVLPSEKLSRLEWSSSDENVLAVESASGSSEKAEGTSSAYNSAVSLKAVSSGTATVSAKVDGVVAECKVNVLEVPLSTIELDITSKELAVGETFMLTATLLPEDISVKNLEWTSSNPSVASIEPVDADVNDNVFACKVSALAPGTSDIAAVSGDVTVKCSVVVKEVETVQADPKVGDYYYSDGTWSDGGLISMDADGTNQKWAENKPAPLDGKTVIGIVFQTDAERIHATDLSNGYKHGYVVCVKSAHSPTKSTTMYSVEPELDLNMSAKRTGVTWYADLDGYGETKTVVEAYADKITNVPAFDWTVTDFSPSAPTSTSGWFLPSTGQLWDMIANLCGSEVAAYLKTMRTYTSDITYTDSHHVSYDVVSEFNSKIALVPDAQKENLVFNGTDYQPSGSGKTSDILCSTLYSSEAVCMFSIGDNGCVWTGCNWTNAEYIARPILAF